MSAPNNRTPDEPSEVCEHEWATHCDDTEHVDVCSICGVEVISPCPDQGTWPEEEEE